MAKKSTNEEFLNKPLSKYITTTIDQLLNNTKIAVDIGCGSGRYSKYLYDNGITVCAIDKYKEMFQLKNNDIKFIQACMDNIPLNNQSADLVLSIGVIHNAVEVNELKESIKEIFRILKSNGKALISIFTNDLITNDLKKIDNNKYSVENRDPMILLSKSEIKDNFLKAGFKNIKEIDEHITDVGGGKRNVYTILLEK